MCYCYETEKHALFTESGVDMLMKMRDHARGLLRAAGAARADKIMEAATGSTWTMLAAIDYMVEKGELRRVTAPGQTWGQHQVFVSGDA